MPSTVEAAFDAFCRAQRPAAGAQEGRLRMDCRTFAQLCRDCHLLDQRYRPVEADVVFARAAGPSHRGLDLGRFEAALALAAEKKGVSLASVFKAVGSSRGPVLHGTIAKSVRFHDGSAAAAGAAQDPASSAPLPVLWRTGSWSESAKLADRVSTWIDDLPSDAGQRSETLDRCVWGKARARTAMFGKALHQSRSAMLEDTSPSSLFEEVAHAQRAARAIGRRARDARKDPVVEVFKQFCGEHDGLMNIDDFEQLCRRCFIIDRKFTGIDARGAFASVLPFGLKWIGINEFNDALEIIARRKGQHEEALRSSVALCVGPKREAAVVDKDAPADPPDKDADYRVGGHRLPKLFRARMST